MASATSLPANPPATAPMTAPTPVPTGPASEPAAAPAAAPPTTPTPVPTAWLVELSFIRVVFFVAMMLVLRLFVSVGVKPLRRKRGKRRAGGEGRCRLPS